MQILNWCLSAKRQDVIMKTMLLLLIGITLRYIWRPWNRRWISSSIEGFDQSAPYSFKSNQAIYDDFYVEMYDHLHKSKSRARFELESIEKALQMDKKNNSILDIGCGTGSMVSELLAKGYLRVQGIDASEAMISHATKETKPVLQCANAKDALLFERAQFSHLFCLYFTIYAFDDKIPFLHNCSQWLMPYGILVLHLVDPHRFDRLAPGAKSRHLPFHPTKGYAHLQKEKVEESKEKPMHTKNTRILFSGFEYQNSISDVDANNEVAVRERFIDRKTGHVRENEQRLYMESCADILAMAATAGFAVKGKFDMRDFNKDAYQYIYLLQKIR